METDQRTTQDWPHPAALGWRCSVTMSYRAPELFCRSLIVSRAESLPPNGSERCCHANASCVRRRSLKLFSDEEFCSVYSLESLYVSNRILHAAKSAAWRARLLGNRLSPSACLALLEPSLRKRVATGAIWSLVGAGLASGLTMLSNIGCARMLGPISYGQLGIVLVTTNLFTNLFTSGLNMTATRYVAGYRDSEPDRAGKIIGLSTVTSVVVGLMIAVLICCLAPWMSRDVLKASGLSSALMLGATAMFFAAVNGSQTGGAQRL